MMAAALLFILSISGCAPKKEDAKKVFGWTQDTYDVFETNEVVAVNIILDGQPHLVLVYDATFSDAPSCSEAGSYTHNEEMDEGDSKTVSLEIHLLDYDDEDIVDPIITTTELKAGLCNTWVIDESEFDW